MLGSDITRNCHTVDFNPSVVSLVLRLFHYRPQSSDLQIQLKGVCGNAQISNDFCNIRNWIIIQGATLQVKINWKTCGATCPSAATPHRPLDRLHMLSGSGGPMAKDGPVLPYYCTICECTLLRYLSSHYRHSSNTALKLRSEMYRTASNNIYYCYRAENIRSCAEALRNWYYYGTEATAKQSSYRWECSHDDSGKYHVMLHRSFIIRQHECLKGTHKCFPKRTNRSFQTSYLPFELWKRNVHFLSRFFVTDY